VEHFWRISAGFLLVLGMFLTMWFLTYTGNIKSNSFTILSKYFLSKSTQNNEENGQIPTMQHLMIF